MAEKRNTSRHLEKKDGDSPPTRPIERISLLSSQKSHLGLRQSISTRTRGQLRSTCSGTDTLSSILEEALASLRRRDRFKIFHNPVDVSVVPGYTAIVEKPMDFSKVETQIHNGYYTSFSDFNRDIELIFANCKQFNAPNTIFFKQASSINLWWKKYRERFQKKEKTFRIRVTPHEVEETPLNNFPPLKQNTLPDLSNTPTLIKNQPMETKRRHLPYLKYRHKLGVCPDSLASLAQILQRQGDKGALNRLAGYRGNQRLLASLHSYPLDGIRKRLHSFVVRSTKSRHDSKTSLSKDTLMSSPMQTIKENQESTSSIHFTPYSKYMRCVVNFLGQDVAQCLMSTLPCVQGTYPEVSKSDPL